MAFLSEKTANEQSGFEADLSSVWKQDDIKGFCLLSKTVFDQITDGMRSGLALNQTYPHYRFMNQKDPLLSFLMPFLELSKQDF